MPGIVVGVDGSGHSRAALEWAVREAAVRHAPLTVVTVHQAPVEYLGSAVDQAQDHDLAERYRQVAQDEVDRVFARTGEARPECVTVQSVNGPATDALLAAALDADMLVVGSRGAVGFPRSLIGSVSSQVTRHANCPVVVIPAQHRRYPPHRACGRRLRTKGPAAPSRRR
jgi:nucleotide-binding universal stress UspA family protein